MDYNKLQLEETENGIHEFFYAISSLQVTTWLAHTEYAEEKDKDLLWII
jgi:hypothetical protein